MVIFPEGRVQSCQESKALGHSIASPGQRIVDLRHSILKLLELPATRDCDGAPRARSAFAMGERDPRDVPRADPSLNVPPLPEWPEVLLPLPATPFSTRRRAGDRDD